MEINVDNEVGKIQKVLVNIPKQMNLNIDENQLQLLLNDYHQLINILKDNNIEIYDIKHLFEEVITNNETAKCEFINNFMNLAINHNEMIISKETGRKILYKYLHLIRNKTLVDEVISGIKVDAVKVLLRNTRVNACGAFSTNAAYLFNDFEIKNNYPYLTDSLVNLCFPNNLCKIIDKHIVFSNLNNNIINQECLILDIIFKYHPNFKDHVFTNWYELTSNNDLNVSDILHITNNTLLLAISKDSSKEALLTLITNIFNDSNNHINNIYMINLENMNINTSLKDLLLPLANNKFIVNELLLNQIISIDCYTFENNNILNEERTFDNIEALLTTITNKEVEVITVNNECINSLLNIITIDENTIILNNNDKLEAILETHNVKCINCNLSSLNAVNQRLHNMVVVLDRKTN